MAKDNAVAFTNIVKVKQLLTKQDILLVIYELENKISETKHEILKWVLGMMMAQTPLIIAAIGIGLAILG